MNLSLNLKFVEFSHGEFEGKTYNNVSLSNGIRTLSFKNKTNLDEVLATFQEGDEVVADIEITFGKKNLIGVLRSIEKA